LSGTDLSGANLTGAKLTGANLADTLSTSPAPLSLERT
jgi:uncharacterized protein YjbI with pentapeptide repeats